MFYFFVVIGRSWFMQSIFNNLFFMIFFCILGLKMEKQWDSGPPWCVLLSRRPTWSWHIQRGKQLRRKWWTKGRSSVLRSLHRCPNSISCSNWAPKGRDFVTLKATWSVFIYLDNVNPFKFKCPSKQPKSLNLVRSNSLEFLQVESFGREKSIVCECVCSSAKVASQKES